MQEPGTAPAWHPDERKIREKTPSVMLRMPPPPEARGRREEHYCAGDGELWHLGAELVRIIGYE